MQDDWLCCHQIIDFEILKTGAVSCEEHCPTAGLTLLNLIAAFTRGEQVHTYCAYWAVIHSDFVSFKII